MLSPCPSHAWLTEPLALWLPEITSSLGDGKSIGTCSVSRGQAAGLVLDFIGPRVSNNFASPARAPLQGCPQCFQLVPRVPPRYILTTADHCVKTAQSGRRGWRALKSEKSGFGLDSDAYFDW